MFAKSTIVVALLVSFVAAQGTTTNSTIDPATVDDTTKSQWCSSEITVCGDLCGGDNTANSCDPSTLNSTCTCANGTAPGLQYYTGSLDTFICEQIYANCISAGENDAAAQKVCTTARDKNCGTLDPDNFTAAVTSTSSSASATATAASTTGSSTGSSTSTSAAAAATLMALGREYGSGVVAVGVAAAFGLIL